MYAPHPQWRMATLFILLPILHAALSKAMGADSPSTSPLVKTKSLTFRGTILPINQSANPFPNDAEFAEVFYGVPYAQPPVGELRFEKPLPFKSTTEEILDCSSYTNNLPCHQQRHRPEVACTEDCLKLNIIRPQGTEAGDDLTVLIYIHPGAFSAGAALLEGPPLNMGLLNFYVSQGIIVVQVQYRLAILGFGSNGDDTVLPGNLGLYDQQLALQWVHSNIHAFGGNPTQTTLFGTSAGAASVAYHTLHPDSYHLFQRAIEMSGSYNGHWGEPSNVSVEYTLRVAKAVGCGSTGDSVSLKNCLKQASMESLQTAMTKYPYARADLSFSRWTPRFDNDFVRGDFNSMVEAAPSKPTLIGFSTDESLPWYIDFPESKIDLLNDWTLLGSTPSDFSREDLANFINRNIVPNKLSTPNGKGATQIGAIRKELISFYAENKSEDHLPPNFYFQRYIHLLSDIQFIVPALWEARLKAQSGWPVYLLHFAHMSSWLEGRLPYPGLHHTAEYPYNIGMDYFGGNGPFNEEDRAVQKALLHYLLSFIRGDIDDDKSARQWPPLPLLRVDAEPTRCAKAMKDYVAMNLNATPYVEDGPGNADIAKRLNFWDELSQRYDLRLVHGFPNTQGQCLPFMGAAAAEEKEEL